jgi:hypothetical protein
VAVYYPYEQLGTEQSTIEDFEHNFCLYVDVIVARTLRSNMLPRLLGRTHTAMVEQARDLTIKAEEAVDGVDPRRGLLCLDRQGA